MSIATNWLGEQHRLEDLVTLTERLTLAMEAQTRQFQSRTALPSAAEHDELMHLANLYRAEIGRVRGDKNALTGTDPKITKKLRDATRKFEASLATHLASLAAMKTVTEGLVRAIGEEVAAQRAGPKAYGPGSGQRASPSHAAITLNQRA